MNGHFTRDEGVGLRILETSLICVDFIIMLYLLWFQPRHNKYLLIGALSILTVSITHLFVEGYRWTMVPLYVVTGILLLLIVLRVVNFKKSTKIHALWRYTGYLFILLLMTVGGFLSTALPVFQLPAPTGEYPVGTQTLHFIDSSRSEIFTDDVEDKRELMVQVWYPAQASQEKRDRLFMMGGQQFSNVMNGYGNSFGLPSFTLKYWKYIGANSYQAAEIQQKVTSYPVVLISHGLGTSKMLHTSQAENLASHGYIVIGIDHTYSSVATLFPDGKVTTFTTELSDKNIQAASGKLEQIWLEDIKYMLEQLEVLNQGDVEGAARFQDRLDLSRIGIMGHSFGGAVAYDAVQANPNLLAGINMDGTLLNSADPEDFSENLSGENKSFLFMFPDSFVQNSTELPENTSISQEISQLMKKERKIINHHIQHGGYGIHIKGTEHFNFTDLQLYSNLLKYTGMTGKIDGKRGAEIVNSLIIQFFDQTLKDKAAPPLSDITLTYPEVEFYQSVQ